MRTLPFWQEDITEKLLAGVLSPVEAVESFIELTDEEKRIREQNFNSPVFGIPGKFFTIYDPESIPIEHLDNFSKTADIVSDIEADLGVSFIVTSFFRSIKHHIRVYFAKGITDIAKIPKLSTHLFGNGIDVIPVGKPVKWLHKLCTEAFLERYNLWMEHESHTPGWVHWQRVPYRSWKPGMSRKYHI
jgi:hypothetical protein